MEWKPWNVVTQLDTKKKCATIKLYAKKTP